jgi:hypothetical protein
MMEAPGALAIDRPLAVMVRHLIESHSLADKVDCIEYPDRGVIEFHRRETLPFRLWSSGERSTWEFVASLAGHGEVDLHKLVSRVGGSGRLAFDLVNVFSASMGLVPSA